MLTDVKSPNMRVALQQIYINLYVEYGMEHRWLASIAGLSWLTRAVVKNPLSPTEHPGGVGVNNELFEQSLEQFVVCSHLPPGALMCPNMCRPGSSLKLTHPAVFVKSNVELGPG